MNRPFSSALGILLGLAVTVGPKGADLRAEITAEQVRKAIEDGVSYLRQEQDSKGAWSEYLYQTGGVTALCTLALLDAGVEPSDPQIQKALAVLRKIQPKHTYVTALQTMVFARAEPEKDGFYIRRNVTWLEEKQIRDGPNKGAWSYPGDAGSSGGDNSNAQFAILALHEAERAGVRAGDATWRLARDHWEGTQNFDGSWGYRRRDPGRGSMTCAGITSLVITADRVQPPDAQVVGNTIRCCRRNEKANEGQVQRGLDWMKNHFSVSSHPGAPSPDWFHYYYLYGLERAGRLTAQRLIGTHDWYREGADWLVRRQDQLSGFWSGSGPAENNPLIGTSFALLFLSKGRWPVLLAKLQHGPGDDWNRHRHDVDNLTRFVEKRWKMDLTWQVTDWRRASVEDLLQSPVLYLCGGKNPLPDDPQQRRRLADKLRDYLDRGGFLFAEGTCSGREFDEGFRTLMKLVFPEAEYRLQLLDPAHPIWHAEQKIPDDQLRPLYGVESGCRTSVVYAPLDPLQNPRPSLSCLWELARSGRGRKYPRSVEAQIDAGLGIGINMLAYATNRELQTKDKIWGTTAPPRPIEKPERGQLTLANLRHPGGCNAAPRALVNLLDRASRELKIQAVAAPQPVALTDDALLNYHLVFMHGRNHFRLTDAERKRLKTYLERGGMLFADSICASKAFTESFRGEMAAVFPDRKLERIAADDPLLSTKYGGFDLKTVTRRDPQPRTEGAPLKAAEKKVPPELEGIKLGDRWAVIFSPYDVSCALEKRDSLECRGYIRQDAARIGLNVLLYSVQQ
ncbi:MAG: DUF4159 domain-containing protein [Pirellulales bacterium]|nr:DUF4159 domain-containing protein [Pirellulales bacterium]